MFVTIGTTLVRVAFTVLLGYVVCWSVFAASERQSFTRPILDSLLAPLLFSGRSQKPRVEQVNHKNPLIFLRWLMVGYLPVLFVYRFPLPLNPEHGNYTSKSPGLSGDGLYGQSNPWPPVWSCESFPGFGRESRSYAHLI